LHTFTVPRLQCARPMLAVTKSLQQAPSSSSSDQAGYAQTSQPGQKPQSKTSPAVERLRTQAQGATSEAIHPSQWKVSSLSSPTGPSPIPGGYTPLQDVQEHAEQHTEAHSGMRFQEMLETRAQSQLSAREINKQLMVLEQRVASVTEGGDARIKLLSDHMQRLQEGLQAMRVAREIQNERRLKELKVVESSLMVDLEKLSESRYEAEARFEEEGKACLVQCHQELENLYSKRRAVHDGFGREITDEVQRLSVLLEEQRTARMYIGERIVGNLEAEFQKVHDAVVLEQKMRFEAESTMVKMVQDVSKKLKDEVREEKEKREAVQAKLLGLLEDTCSRIEGSFAPGDSSRRLIMG